MLKLQYKNVTELSNISSSQKREMKNQIIFFGISMLVFACSTSTEVEWLKWEQGEKAVAESSKKVIVWVYDPSCSTCKEAEQRIFNTPKINQYLNQHFIPIKLSGKRKETITTKGKTFIYRQGLNGYDFHDLAQAITQSKETISYPQLVFLDENMEIIAPLSGNIQPDELDLLLHFVAEEQFKKMSIDQYKLKIK